MAPTIAEKLAENVESRQRYFARMQRAYDLINQENKKSEFLQRALLADATFEKYEEVTNQICQCNLKLTDATARIETSSATAAFEELYFHVKAYESALKEQARENIAVASGITEHNLKIKLPTISIPTFSGNLEEFPSWKSLYVELIHNNTELSDIQKFSYLRSYLIDEPLKCVENVTFVANNYALAFKSLNDRYGKKRLLASSYLNKLVHFEPIKSESVNGLNSFLNTFDINVESLKGLLIPSLSEFIFLHLGLQALDSNTRQDFETANIQHDFPKFEDLITFVRRRCSVLEVSASAVTPSASCSTDVSEKSKKAKSGNSTSLKKCLMCSKDHSLYKCPSFIKLDPSVRVEKVKELKVCLLCLNSTHSRLDCKFKAKCRHCNKSNHNSLLHITKSDSSAAASTNQPQLCGTIEESNCATVLLGTAMVQVKDVNGDFHVVRMVIDPGSQVSAVSERLAQILKLPRKKNKIQISGIGSDNTIEAKGEISCIIQPHQRISTVNQDLEIKAVIIPKIAMGINPVLSDAVITKFQHLHLADSSLLNKNQNNSIDILLGAEYYADVLVSSLPIISGYPAAIPSRFGWFLMGRVDGTNQEGNYTSLFITSQDPVSTQLHKFWEMEVLPEDKSLLSPEEVACENHFMDTHRRDLTGRYNVSLPFKAGVQPILGSNRNIALRRLKSVKERLNKDNTFKQLYQENLESYLECGHMILASESSSYLLLHHGVFKSTSSTTKLRVVFDPNVKGSGQISLADSLLVGPKLQKNIGDLLINFRLKSVAITCDIQAMYRSINLHEADQKYQHILWSTDDQEIIEYQLTTVTFGLPSSPYLAQRVLKQLVLDEGERFPKAAKIISDSVYVDDIVAGASSIEEACVIKNEIINLLGSGGFKVRKWSSSHPAAINDVPVEDREIMNVFGDAEVIKVLGLQWDPKTDSFCYNTDPINETITKRKILSRIATIFDVNGLIAPVVVWLKIFLQQMWLNKDITWDSPLPSTLQEKWVGFNNELPQLTFLRIPRYILSESYSSVDLIGFCDSSSNAYGAVSYLRVTTASGAIQVQLVRAKTKVAPLKTISIPRLELCAAHLLAKMIKSLNFLFESIEIKNVFLFSDSTTALSWIKTPPHMLKTFVANRVTQILETTEPSQWRYVPTKENSADSASRGLMPSDFMNNSLWFDGPSFLKQDPSLWPQCASQVSHAHEEMKPLKTLLIQEVPNYFISIFERYSSLSKLERVMACVLRFIHNSRSKTGDKKLGSLTVMELKNARLSCIKISQREYYRTDIHNIKKGIPCVSSLRFLSPFLDSDNLLLVGGRLSQAPLPSSAKHPILIPPKCHLATLLINFYHVLTMHGGPRLIQSLMHRHYWITGCRSLIRKCIHRCIPCFRASPKLSQPYMADLPSSRFTQGRAFLQVGVDFAGPFSMKTGPRRNSPIAKCYFAIFVCMSTKAVHIELVTALSLEAFIATLDRFISRRGLPSHIHSDNGSNFKASARYISEVQLFLSNSFEHINYYLKSKEITWSFIPPNAPNFGGLWEAGVKSIKSHLKYVLHENQSFTYEELYTILVKIEAILNSRPLCSLGSTPIDGTDILTPGHFLIGAPLLARPEYDFSDVNSSLLKRWQLLSQASQCFWHRWSRDYLNTLIQRSKWTTPTENVKIGDIVLIHQSTPVQTWPLGRVVEILPSSDEFSRVVKIKLANGELVRPVSKIAILPLK